jgi:hypothetical protein
MRGAIQTKLAAGRFEADQATGHAKPEAAGLVLLDGVDAAGRARAV